MLATDIANFTPLVESYGADPRAFVSLLNQYFDAISGPIADAVPPGTIIDTAGDGLLAIWDAPSNQREMRLAACLAALGIRDAVLRFNRENPDTPMPTRVGLHAGDLAMGEVDVRQQRFVKAVGHVTNTAARIEALNKHLGTTLLASTAVMEGLEDVLLIRPCGEFLLPGRGKAIGVVEIVGLRTHAQPWQIALVESFGKGLACYGAGRVGEASTAFSGILADYPQDGPSHIYAEECAKAHSHTGGIGVGNAIVIHKK